MADEGENTEEVFFYPILLNFCAPEAEVASRAASSN